jgi:ubiquinone/menaquinone biosynthesis C-methylase UbiE
VEGGKMDSINNRVCPVERAGSLDTIFRRWLQNPRKILSPWVKEGMTVLDYGCGPGFFTIDIAQMVGASGRVIAADLQEGMLQKLGKKIHKTEIENRISLHRCRQDRIGIFEKVDFTLAFYVLHEIPEQSKFFVELESILKPDGHVLIVEPPFHVSKSDFLKTVEEAQNAGFNPVQGPKVLLSKSVILKKCDVEAPRWNATLGKQRK